MKFLKIKYIVVFSLVVIIVTNYSCKKDNNTVSANGLKWNSYSANNINVTGLTRFWVNSITLDSLGRLWFGTGNGVLLDSVPATGNKWLLYSRNDSSASSNYSITEIAFDKQGNAWVATFGDGVLLLNFTDAAFQPAKDTLVWTDFTIANGLAGDTVRAVAIDTSGNKWFSTSGGIAERKKNDTLWYKYNNLGLTNDTITCISLFNKALWIGTFREGIFKFDSTIHQEYNAGNVKGNVIYASAVDGQGNIWYGTANGVLKFDGSTWTTYPAAITNGLINNSVFSVAVDHYGNKWFGTAAGVSEFDGKNWTSYTTNNGLQSNTVLAILADKQNNIWFGTNEGISELLWSSVK